MSNWKIITSQNLINVQIGQSFGAKFYDGNENYDLLKNIDHWCSIVDILDDKILCFVINGWWYFEFDRRHFQNFELYCFINKIRLS